MTDLAPLFTWRSALCDSDLKPTVRHVLLTLALHMNERGGSCWPSFETLARETGLHRATVIRAIESAEEDGWLAVERSKGRTSHRYSAVRPSRTTTVQPSLSATVAQNNRRPVRAQPSLSARPTVAQCDPSTSLSTSRSTSSAASGAKKPERKRDELFDAVMAACGLDFADTPKSAMSGIAKVVHELREVGATPDEINARAKRYRELFEKAPLTPYALRKNWAGCRTEGQTVDSSRKTRVRDGIAEVWVAGSGWARDHRAPTPGDWED